jgi:hypothetical protein
MMAKLLVIMVLPLSMRLQMGDFNSYMYYVSVLFSAGADPRWLVYEPPPGIFPSLNLNLLLIISALIMCAPGIYFDYWLSRQPRGKSIKKQLFATLVLVPMMIFPVAFLFLGRVIDPGFYPYSFSLVLLPTWVVVVLVLLPVFTREGRFIDVAKRRQSLESASDYQESSISRFPGRGMAMALIVGLVALVGPFFVHSYSWSGGQTTMRFLSTSCNYVLESWSGVAYFEIIPNAFAPIYGLTYLLAPSLLAFNLLFGHNVLLYLQSRASIVRTAIYGILGMGFPFLLYYIQSLMTGPMMDYTSHFLPTPILQALGILMVLFIEPTKQEDRIWEDTDDRMWFDKSDQEAGGAPEHRPKVTIPLTYLLRSRIRAVLNGSNTRVAGGNPQKAEWAHDEEIWS